MLAICRFALVCLGERDIHTVAKSGYGGQFKKLMVGIINKYFISLFTCSKALRLATPKHETLGRKIIYLALAAAPIWSSNRAQAAAAASAPRSAIAAGVGDGRVGAACARELRHAGGGAAKRRLTEPGIARPAPENVIPAQAAIQATYGSRRYGFSPARELRSASGRNDVVFAVLKEPAGLLRQPR